MPDIELIVDGKAYGGWTSIALTRSLEQLAHTFSIAFTERWLPDATLIPIREGQACTVQYGSAKVFDGYVDDCDPEYDASNHSASIAGRSRTGDLVDCSAVHHGSWKDSTLKKIASDLCAPFGVKVSVAAGVDVGAPFKTFGLQDAGEKVFEALERAARMRAVFFTTDAAGNLVITRAAKKKTKTVLERGVNIKRGARSGSMRERFSQYTLIAQTQGNVKDIFGNPRATAKDSGVKRYRPLVVMADGDAIGSLQKRADWERNHRRGKAQRFTYTVEGWENAEGLWDANELVAVRDPWFQLEGDFLIITAKLSRDERGTVTDLEIASPDAVSIEPPKPVPDKGLGFLQ